jgi:hypothetical protein
MAMSDSSAHIHPLNLSRVDYSIQYSDRYEGSQLNLTSQIFIFRGSRLIQVPPYYSYSIVNSNIFHVGFFVDADSNVNYFNSLRLLGSGFIEIDGDVSQFSKLVSSYLESTNDDHYSPADDYYDHEQFIVASTPTGFNGLYVETLNMSIVGNLHIMNAHFVVTYLDLLPQGVIDTSVQVYSDSTMHFINLTLSSCINNLPKADFSCGVNYTYNGTLSSNGTVILSTSGHVHLRSNASVRGSAIAFCSNKIKIDSDAVVSTKGAMLTEL